jgi:phage shock protein A
MMPGMSNFDSTVRATNALTATNEFYSAELARVVKAYSDLDDLHQRLLQRLLDQGKRLEAATTFVQDVQQAIKAKQSTVLASSLKSKHQVTFDAVSAWDLSTLVEKYLAALEPKSNG